MKHLIVKIVSCYHNPPYNNTPYNIDIDCIYTFNSKISANAFMTATTHTMQDIQYHVINSPIKCGNNIVSDSFHNFIMNTCQNDYMVIDYRVFSEDNFIEFMQEMTDIDDINLYYDSNESTLEALTMKSYDALIAYLAHNKNYEAIETLFGLDIDESIIEDAKWNYMGLYVNC